MPMPTEPTDRNVDYSLIYVLLALVLICFLAIAGPLVSEAATFSWARCGATTATRRPSLPPTPIRK